jgi:hypothetical protein
MDMFTSAQEKGCEATQLKMCQYTTYNGTNYNHQHPLVTSNNATTTPIRSPSSNLGAVTATLTTTELLEQILSYLPAPHLLTSKRTCTSFRNAIETSPTLRRKTSTFLRLGNVEVDDENDSSFSTDAGGEVVFPIEGLGVLGFFYPGEGGERRMFVRFDVGDWEGFLGRVGKGGGGGGFGRLRIVDQRLGDVRVGWFCGCFEEGTAEVKLSCPMADMVTFGIVFSAMEEEHRCKGLGRCASLRKFWVDGLWMRSGEKREFGR